jgi:purine nucleoside phosphorylase
MKVLAGPRVDLRPDGGPARVCRALAREGGENVSLAEAGIHNPYRRFSTAEIAALRSLLRGETGVVGYVCTGVAARGAGRLVVVTDHVNLTWRSPLEGPNDDDAGPRFPAMDGVYAPEVAEPLCGDLGDVLLSRGVVAGVADDRALSEHEIRAVGMSDWAAVSAELVAPVILAAHMGLRVAAVVMV